jgi:hypothetical protein
MRRNRNRARDYAKYWKTVPAHITALMLLTAFSLFASMAFILGMMQGVYMPLAWTWGYVLISGFSAAGLAYTGLRQLHKWTAVVAVVECFAIMLMTREFSRVSEKIPATPQGLHELTVRLRVEGALAILCLVIGYSLINSLIKSEGLRLFGPLTEMKLAGEVHQALVPAIASHIDDYEIYGVSYASGEVGGDLVDLIQHGPEWSAYVADVSGHGVSAGIVMAMVKSAIRMGSLKQRELGEVLGDLNRVLCSTSANNVFATYAGVRSAKTGLQFVLAGHLPILHYRKRQNLVEQHSVSNLPVGVMEEVAFESGTILCEPGDVLAILTDGLVEAADDQQNELGLDPFELNLVRSGDLPLGKIAETFRAIALQQGKQMDDQTVLLIRKT